LKRKSCNSKVSAGNRWQYPPIGKGAGFGQNDYGVGIEEISMTNETSPRHKAIIKTIQAYIKQRFDLHEKRRDCAVMKKYISIIIAAVLVILAIYTVNYVSNPERQIKNFINENSKELVTIAESYLNSDTTVKTYKGVKVEQAFRGNNDIVQFYYGGKGIAPASKYYGFYYSPDDVPVAYQNANCNLTDVSDDEWKWSDGTDNGGRTIRIMENWFYYEAWF